MSKSSNSTGRTLLRGFLVVGGLALLGLGLLRGGPFNIVFGLVAALLGGFGLWWELFRDSPEADTADSE